MKPDAEIVIVGAGCAGLSLAAALAAERVPGRVLLLEPRTTYTRDRTWCFWNTEEHPFSSSISHSWNRWRVSAGGSEAVQKSSRYPYCHIAGDDFYRAALEGVACEREQELRQGVSVQSIELQPDGSTALETNRGRVLAGRVFDSRPPAATEKRRPVLVQRFLGWHVRATEPCFDPQTVELMQFLPSREPGRVRFLYLLPFSSTEALAEMTYLDDPALTEPAYEQDLANWLGEQCASWEVLYTERGALPMSAGETPAATDGVVPIGIRGGRLKPSSGYGFLRIQRHSRALARAVRDGGPLPRTAEPGFYGAMDAVFLEALRQRPQFASELFLRLFAQSNPDALVRFLSEASASPGEVLRVAWPLPKTVMLRAALSALRPTGNARKVRKTERAQA